MSKRLKPDFAKNLEIPLEVRAIVKTIASRGGQALVVGGLVRDLALGRESRDLDIEVHKMPIDLLEEVLCQFGSVDLVGRQFGVLLLKGVAVDWSVPRRDSTGRHPKVESDPWMGIKEAARRRDLTINAMAIDPLDGTLYDPFGGLLDLKKKILRPPDAARFVEDPLRFFRVMAFSAKLEMSPAQELNQICQSMDLEEVARERIEDEFTKMLLKSERPSIGFRWLESVGRLQEILPEAFLLVGLEQDPKWHPEGSVWEHTMQVVDAAAQLKMDDKEQNLMLLWAAFCHDLGKAETTVFADNHIRSPGHTERSEELAEILLTRILNLRGVIRGAAKLSAHHLKPHDFFVNKAKPKAFKRLALALSPETNLERLATLALADYRGRNPKGPEPLEVPSQECQWFLERASDLKVKCEPEKPVLMGRHLLDVMPPGPKMGKLLHRAYEIQLSENLKDVNLLKSRILEEYEKK